MQKVNVKFKLVIFCVNYVKNREMNRKEMWWLKCILLNKVNTTHFIAIKLCYIT